MTDGDATSTETRGAFIEIGRKVDDHNRMFLGVPARDAGRTCRPGGGEMVLATFDADRDLRWIAAQLLAHLDEDEAGAAVADAAAYRADLLAEEDDDTSDDDGPFLPRDMQRVQAAAPGRSCVAGREDRDHG